MKKEFSAAQIQRIKEALPFWCEQFDYACILNSNNLASACGYDNYELIVGVSNGKTRTYSHLNSMVPSSSWKLGYFSYDYNHSLFGMKQTEKSRSNFESCFFFEPQIMVLLKNHSFEIEIIGSDEDLIYEIIHYKRGEESHSEIKMEAVTSRKEYLSNVEKIKKQITDGDFYELNYCMEFFDKNAKISAAQVFHQLTIISPTPFASYFKHRQNYLLCASPERFLKKNGDTIIAQPMKGTIRRGMNTTDDEALKEALFQSEKERAENIMIVDLMRNDLAQCAETGSVVAQELLGVYSFATVHQLISTVTATLRKNISIDEIFTHTFPMGSMTGAPKREVMQNIDAYEPVARGLFSGSVGYISPDDDFDFNVVIRSIVYNKETHYLSCHVGSAITYDANGEQEYDECLLKTRTMFGALGIAH